MKSKDISIYFKPLPEDLALLLQTNENNSGRLTDYINGFVNENNFPDWESSKIVLIGVNEDRNSENKGCSMAPNTIRRSLYNLYTQKLGFRIADLGNINAGHTINDTFYALSTAIKEIIKKNKTIIVLGGTQNLTYACYKAFESLEQVINITAIDNRFDIGNDQENCTSNSYLSHIILHQPSFLFNYSNIGYQSYFVSQQEVDLMDKLYFDAHRLGICQNNLEEIEPIIRNADIVSIDISSVRKSDAPASLNATPNGFYGEELCQLCRYAGFSDKTSVVGFFEVNPQADNGNQTSFLTAEAIWYFIEGFSNRKQELPISGNDEYTKYRVPINDSNQHEIVFFKSQKSARWWMSVPFPPDKQLKFERHHLVPCSYEDYKIATNNEIPDRWWQTYQKLC